MLRTCRPLPHLHLARAEAFDLGLRDVTAHDGVVLFAARHAVILRGSGAAARSSATSRMPTTPANDAERASNGPFIEGSRNFTSRANRGKMGHPWQKGDPQGRNSLQFTLPLPSAPQA